MTEQEIMQLFSVLTVDLDDLKLIIDDKPLLAHYTSINVLEKIMKNNEIWLSNPLFMNDLEEVRFGFYEGIRLFEQCENLTRSCKTDHREIILRDAFNHYVEEFEDKHAFDTYVFCLSTHDPKNTNGLLSMWRGYGGQGNGAALVFNTKFVDAPDENSPLILTRVHYASKEGRKAWLKEKINQWCNLLEAAVIPDDKLYVAAYSLFHLIKFFALKSKHDGFQEEQEWRIIYMPKPGRDLTGVWKERCKFDYFMTTRGAEPKLKLKIEPLDANQTWTFENIIDRIILGPCLSSHLAQRGIERMLKIVGKAEFQQKVCASDIPLRPT
jgi:Protein of unknown function (DUF2971)